MKRRMKENSRTEENKVFKKNSREEEEKSIDWEKGRLEKRRQRDNDRHDYHAGISNKSYLQYGVER